MSTPAKQIVAVGEHVGGDVYGFADGPLDREAAAVDSRRDVLDDDAQRGGDVGPASFDADSGFDALDLGLTDEIAYVETCSSKRLPDPVHQAPGGIERAVSLWQKNSPC